MKKRDIIIIIYAGIAAFLLIDPLFALMAVAGLLLVAWIVGRL